MSDTLSEKRKLTAPCGLDCFNCRFYEANITPEMAAAFAQHRGIPPSRVACPGCRSAGGCRLNYEVCETLECANARGVEFCGECADFPCPKLQPVADGAERFPHNLKLYNLCRIKAVGFERWAAEAADISCRYFMGRFDAGKGPVLD